MNCSIPQCERIALIPINRQARDEPPMKLCQYHYYKMLRRLRDGGECEDVYGLSNLEIEALVSGNEFKAMIAKVLADAKENA